MGKPVYIQSLSLFPRESHPDSNQLLAGEAIGGIIRDVNEVTTAIAAAVEEQGAATHVAPSRRRKAPKISPTTSSVSAPARTRPARRRRMSKPLRSC